MEYTLLVIYYLLGGYVLFYSLYWCYLSIFSTIYHFYNTHNLHKKKSKLHIEKLLIIFPAYEPNRQLLKAIEAAQKMNTEIPVQIMVLLQKDTYQIKEHLQKLDIHLIEKSFLSAKGNPYHEALRVCATQAIQFNASHVLLLDKDNICEQNFMSNIIKFGNTSADVWQGKRIGIKQKSSAAIYDTISEKINDALLREAKQIQKLPPELSGSAIVFKTEAFHTATNKLDHRAPGMDKNLLIQLLLANKKIDYVPQAIVAEEKTEDEKILKTQRMRWFGNQYFNAFYWGLNLIKKGKFATIDYCITLYRPPRSIQLVLLPILSAIELIFSLGLLFTLSWWFTVLGIVIFIAKEKLWKSVFSIFIFLPKVAINNLVSAIKGSSKKQQGKFLATERTLNDIDKAA